MKITLSDGKAFDIRFIGALLRNSNQVVIELEDGRALSKIAANFEGVKTITKTDSGNPNIKEVYEGYTQLVSIHMNRAAGTVRLTLEKGDAA